LGVRDRGVDSYIANAPDFAKPILEHVRAVVHESCPAVQETMKRFSPSGRALVLEQEKSRVAPDAALKKNKKTQYVEWITEAKGDDTRARRIATTIEWLCEGKSRNWKYMKK
jgi:hypothetical protein